jgi:hypothetical protein
VPMRSDTRKVSATTQRSPGMIFVLLCASVSLW